MPIALARSIRSLRLCFCVVREPALTKHLHGMNVLTVGDLCSLTEQEVHHLPIAQPKVLNVRRAMNKFAARNQLNTGDVTWYQLAAVYCRFSCVVLAVG